MQSKEIPQQEWEQFFNNFSRKHFGRPVGIEVIGAEVGAQLQESGLALEGITAEPQKDSGAIISIMLGTNPSDHLTHLIDRPVQVSLDRDDRGDDFALAIKGANGNMAIMRFESSPCWR